MRPSPQKCTKSTNEGIKPSATDCRFGDILGSVPCKAVYREIGPVLWKISPTDFVKISKKDAFLIFLSNVQPKQMILAQDSLQFCKNLVELPKLKNLRGNTDLMYDPFL